jgi:2-hydroxymuconate-semialdehyde hydrolase
MTTELAVSESRVPTGGLESNVLVAGDRDAPAVILMHGSGPGANAASNWLPVMPDLARDHFVLAPDMVGFGSTECPKTYPSHIMAWVGMRVEQVIGILDHFGIGKAHIVGNSMGGLVTLNAIVEQPERFDRVALMGSIGAPVRERRAELARIFAFWADPRFAPFREIIRTFVYDPDSFPGLEEIIRQRWEAASDPKVAEIQQVMFDSLRTGVDAVALPAETLAGLPHEVLIFHGRQDRVVPLDQSIYLVQNLKHAELVVLDRCGHWAQLQRWDAMGPLLMNHLNPE